MDTSREPEHAGSTSSGGKSIVAFFSWSGNTRTIANQIHEYVGGDLFEIVSVDSYPRDYDECVEKARQELDKASRPRLRSEVDDWGSYDVVFVGYPNWWGTIPMPVATFLMKCDSPDRTIAPFCTHGGGRLGRSVEDITKLCPRSKMLDALAVSEGNVKRAGDQVSDWLHRIGTMR
ncbi:TPA: flavodoxin [Thermoplasmata archaeon]|nr:flavodoxin [Thermoplasmata archaeon]